MTPNAHPAVTTLGDILGERACQQSTSPVRTCSPALVERALAHDVVSQVIERAARRAAALISEHPARISVHREPERYFDACGDTYGAYYELAEAGLLDADEEKLAALICRRAEGPGLPRPASPAGIAQLHSLLIDTARHARRLLMTQDALTLH